MASTSKLKDIDELSFGNTKAERESEIAVKLTKITQYLSLIKHEYHGQTTDVLKHLNADDICCAKERIEKGKSSIETALTNMMSDCEHMLKLTRKKTVTKHTDSATTAQQNYVAKLEACKARADGVEVKKKDHSHLGKIKQMNNKYKNNSTDKKNTKRSNGFAAPVTRNKKTKHDNGGKNNKIDTVNQLLENTIHDKDDSIIVHAICGKEMRQFILPKPSNNFHPKIYSLHECILHCAQYHGKGLHDLVRALIDQSRVCFSLMTFRRHFDSYRKHGSLPDVDVMVNRVGRNPYLDINEMKASHKDVKNNTSLGDDAVHDIQMQIEEKNKGVSGKMLKPPSHDTLIRTASASVVIDEDVIEINDDELRAISMPREIASRSVRTAVTEIATSIVTLFIPGEWHNRPSNKDLPTGCKIALKLAEAYYGCPVKPIDPRYDFDFDDTGRFHYSAAKTEKRKKTIPRVTKQGNSVRGSTSVRRTARAEDAKTSNIKTKFKKLVNGQGMHADECVEFPIFTKEELTELFVVLRIKGLSGDGDSAINGRLAGVVT